MNRGFCRRFVFAVALVASLGTFAAADTPPAEGAHAASENLFETKVRPILAGTCLKCHRGKNARGGLRLDSHAGLLHGGDHGPAIVPGEPDRSLLIQAVRHEHDEVDMPPDEPLGEQAIEDLTAWVRQGASWPPEVAALLANTVEATWAFEPLDDAEPPPDASGWSTNTIDRFIRAKFAVNGLEPAAEADKRTWIRRVTFDLIGLPPKPEEIEAFLADADPCAWPRVVDRLVASPHYGERWGRHWLDVVRYADTGGFEADHQYPKAWQYRDYVLRSFAADKPFDRFLQEQVAGDELWPDDPDALCATDMYCVGPVLGESAMIEDQLEYEWLTDAADTTGAAFLGLTLGCARCHDHKYDPITQRDYYAVQAIFAASDRPFPDKVRTGRIKALNGMLAETPLPKELEHDPRCTVHTDRHAGFRLFHREQPFAVHRLHRGELSRPCEEVGPGLPAALAGGPAAPDFADVGPSRRRAALAQWLTSRDNPLTARVLVNRVWGWHFGQGLVRTPNDFGAQGEPPTHPELLDWLARDFMKHGWSLKRLNRQIVLSSTYRMSSIADGAAGDPNRGDPRTIDPQNRWLWHFPRRRLEAEAIRDAMFACAGTLNERQFGAPVVPPLSREELTGLFDANSKWPVTKDAAEHRRRSVYLLVRRTFRLPVVGRFRSARDHGQLCATVRDRRADPGAGAFERPRGARAVGGAGAAVARRVRDRPR